MHSAALLSFHLYFTALPHSTSLLCGYCLPLQSGGRGSLANVGGVHSDDPHCTAAPALSAQGQDSQRLTFLDLLYSVIIYAACSQEMEQDNNPFTPKGGTPLSAIIPVTSRQLRSLALSIYYQWCRKHRQDISNIPISFLK